MTLVRLASIGLTATLLLTAAGAIWWVQDAEDSAAHEQVELASSQAALRLQDYLESRLLVLESIAREKQSGLLEDEQSFMSSVVTPLARFGGFKAINWIDASGKILWLNPSEGNERARGRNVLEHEQAGPFLKRALDTGEPQMTSILEFFQGGVGFAVYQPVVHGGEILGAVNGVFDSPAAVTDCLAEGMLGSYEVRVRDGEQLVFSSELFAEAKERDFASASLAILDREWKLEVAPNELLYRSQHPGNAWFVLIGAAGFLLASLALVLEFSKRRRGEVEKARLAALVEESADVHMIVSPEGKIRYLNAAGASLLGPDRAQHGSHFQELFHSDDRLAGSSLHERLGESDRWAGDAVLKSANDEAIPFLLRIVRLREDMAGGYRVAVAASDLREQRQLEAELREVQKMEAIGHLAGGIAHDFNNLLTALLGFARMARNSEGLPEPVLSDLDQVIQAGERGAALTRNLLIVSQRQVTDARPVSVLEQINQTRPILGSLVRENIEFSFEVANDLGAVVIDPVQLEQILMNLILNSVNAMPEGGQLRVRVEKRTDDGEWVVLSVEDTGCGMSPEVQARATEPFFSTRARGRGTGLGLFSVSGITERYGGRLVLTSGEDEGTRVEVWLPQTSESPEAPLPSTYQAPGSLNGRGKILLTEDDSAVLESARRSLESAGYTVLAARDGQEALRLFESDPASFDLLISDIVLPRMNGRELARELVARNPGLSVILCSGYVERELKGEELRALNAVFLVKPYGSGDLLLAAKRQLEARFRPDSEQRTIPT